MAKTFHFPGRFPAFLSLASRSIYAPSRFLFKLFSFFRFENMVDLYGKLEYNTSITAADNLIHFMMFLAMNHWNRFYGKGYL